MIDTGVSAPAPASAGAVIAAACVGPGHDGRAEVVIEIAYPNGGRGHLSVPEESTIRCLDAAGLDRLDQLIGQSWTLLLGNTARPDQLDIAPPNSNKPQE